MKKTIAAICGGFSSEREISMKSIGTIIDNLDRSKYNVHRVVIDGGGWRAEVGDNVVEIDKTDFSAGEVRFDFAFIMIHGTPGEDGKLQAYFDMLGIPYSTSPHIMSALTFNKWACNNLLRNFGIACADSVLVGKHAEYDASDIGKRLGFPLFVKPNDGGSSFGISKVFEEKDIGPAIDKARAEGTDAILESFLDGREVTCGAYRDGGDIICLPITEILTDNEFFDYKAKYSGESNEVTPARIEDGMVEKVHNIVTEIYTTLGLEGIIRVDFIIVDNDPVLVEVNTVPGFSPASIVPQQIQVAGGSLPDVLDTVIKQGFEWFQ